jgi:hypothetical protein
METGLRVYSMKAIVCGFFLLLLFQSVHAQGHRTNQRVLSGIDSLLIAPHISKLGATPSPSPTPAPDTSGGASIIGVFSLFWLLLYFLPSMIGMRKHNAGAIFVLNFFLGWTFVGWVGALIWACTHEQVRKPEIVIINETPAQLTAAYQQAIPPAPIEHQPTQRESDSLSIID